MFNITLFPLLFFSFIHIFGQGFVAGTLVKTTDGYVPIERIKPGNQVISYNYNNAKIPCLVKEVYYYEVKEYISIIAPHNRIDMGLTQRIFLPTQHDWIKAQQLISDTDLLHDLQNNRFITKATTIQKPVRLYDLCVTPFHNFYVSTDDLCVHNTTLGIGEGALYFCLSNPVTCGPTLAAIGGFALAAGVSYIADRIKQNNQNAKKSAQIESNLHKRYLDINQPNFFIVTPYGQVEGVHWNIQRIVNQFKNPGTQEFRHEFNPTTIGQAVYENVLAGTELEAFARKMAREATLEAERQLSAKEQAWKIAQEKEKQTKSSTKNTDKIETLVPSIATTESPSSDICAYPIPDQTHWSDGILITEPVEQIDSKNSCFPIDDPTIKELNNPVIGCGNTEQ